MQVVYELSRGGAETLAQAIGLEGIKRGVRMSICGIGASRTLCSSLEVAGIAAYSMDRASGFQPRLMARLYRLFVRERVTSVITHHLGQLVYAGLAARLAGARLVHVEHEYYSLRSPKDQRLLRLASRLTDRVVSVSEEVAEFLRSVARVPAEKLVIIRNGVDLDRFAPAVVGARHDVDLPQGVPIVGTVGRLDPAKDHLTLLRAFVQVREAIPSARLIIVGDGVCRTDIEGFIGTHDLKANVCLLGERGDIPALLRCMDLFALSSINEGLPLALLEAMACERPVVTTDVGAAGGVVRRANAGLVVPPQDAGALAGAMITMLKDRSLARSLGTMGRKAVEEQYDLATTLDSYLTLCAREAA